MPSTPTSSTHHTGRDVRGVGTLPGLVLVGATVAAAGPAEEVLRAERTVEDGQFAALKFAQLVLPVRDQQGGVDDLLDLEWCGYRDLGF